MPDDTIFPFGFPAIGRRKLAAAFDGGVLLERGPSMWIVRLSATSPASFVVFVGIWLFQLNNIAKRMRASREIHMIWNENSRRLRDFVGGSGDRG